MAASPSNTNPGRWRALGSSVVSVPTVLGVPDVLGVLGVMSVLDVVSC